MQLRRSIRVRSKSEDEPAKRRLSKPNSSRRLSNILEDDGLSEVTLDSSGPGSSVDTSSVFSSRVSQPEPNKKAASRRKLRAVKMNADQKAFPSEMELTPTHDGLKFVDWLFKTKNEPKPDPSVWFGVKRHIVAKRITSRGKVEHFSSR